MKWMELESIMYWTQRLVRIWTNWNRKWLEFVHEILWEKINFKYVYQTAENVQRMSEDQRKIFSTKFKLTFHLENVQSLTRTVLDACEIQKAFQVSVLVSSGKHIGKFLIKIRNIDNSVLPVKAAVLTQWKFDSHFVAIEFSG